MVWLTCAEDCLIVVIKVILMIIKSLLWRAVERWHHDTLNTEDILLLLFMLVFLSLCHSSKLTTNKISTVAFGRISNFEFSAECEITCEETRLCWVNVILHMASHEIMAGCCPVGSTGDTGGEALHSVTSSKYLKQSVIYSLHPAFPRCPRPNHPIRPVWFPLV